MASAMRERPGTLASVVSSQARRSSTIGRRCQSKFDYSARAPDSYFATIDFPRFFRFDLGGCTAISGVQNFALTVPSSGVRLLF
jgi:hypothetical protein